MTYCDFLSRRRRRSTRDPSQTQPSARNRAVRLPLAMVGECRSLKDEGAQAVMPRGCVTTRRTQVVTRRTLGLAAFGAAVTGLGPSWLYEQSASTASNQR